MIYYKYTVIYNDDCQWRTAKKVCDKGLARHISIINATITTMSIYLVIESRNPRKMHKGKVQFIQYKMAFFNPV